MTISINSLTSATGVNGGAAGTAGGVSHPVVKMKARGSRWRREHLNRSVFIAAVGHAKAESRT
tara:strand:- start:117 stop:305 length:189 start_codon:yes stop_codon:yes gene_type:complete